MAVRARLIQALRAIRIMVSRFLSSAAKGVSLGKSACMKV